MIIFAAKTRCCCCGGGGCRCGWREEADEFAIFLFVFFRLFLKDPTLGLFHLFYLVGL